MPNIYHRRLAKIWFLVNLFIALYPPLYWWVENQRTVSASELPITFVYFLVISISITLSILYAYWADSQSEEWQ